jgi:hypothetical protein
MTNNTNEIIGLQGITGAQGSIGAQGNIGAQGQRGIQGAQGRIGMNGAQGIQGLRGEHGLGGFIGLQGTQGTQGIQGHRGPRGYMGCIGKPGEVGIQGLQGAKGHIWVDGISLDGYNTHLFQLENGKLVSIDGSILTVNNGAKISIWFDQNVYDYLINNNGQVTVETTTYSTLNNNKEGIYKEDITSGLYYNNNTLFTSIVNIERDLNTIVEFVYYNNIWYYVGGLAGCIKSNDQPDEPVQPEVITYTAGNGIDINNNVINVKISAIDNNSLQLTENGELYVPQVEIPEAVDYTAGNGININENNEIELKISTSEDSNLSINENGELFVPKVEIPEVVEYTAGNSIEITEDNKINVTISDVENNVLTTDENGKLYVPQVEIPEIPEQIEYTAGQGLNINENNEIGLKISQSENNSLTIDENGDLFVPQVEIPEQEPVSSIQNFITKDLTNIIDVTYWGLDEELNLIQVEDGMAIEPGHKYLVIITTDGKMYWVENDDTDTDTYVTGFNLLLNENNEQILRITLNNNTVYDIPTSNFIIPVEEPYNVISLDQDSEYVKVNVTKNDEDKQYELKTSIKTVSLFDLPEDENGLVTAQDIKEYVKWYVLEQFKKMHPDAEVYYDETEDTMVINKEGTIGPDDLEEIENYIDNANMGTY